MIIFQQKLRNYNHVNVEFTADPVCWIALDVQRWPASVQYVTCMKEMIRKGETEEE